MKKNFFNIINELKEEVKKQPIYPIIAKRLIDNYDESIDYSRFKFLCPFHNDEHTGNMDVKKTKYRCFACNANGDMINFVEDFDGVSFSTAVLTCALELDIISQKDFDSLNSGSVKKVNIQKKNSVITTSTKKDATNKENLNKIYSYFIKGMTYLNKPLLNEKHKNHLLNERKLSEEEINNVGYFTFPNIYILKHMIKELKESNEDFKEEILEYVPGFYYNKQKGKYSFVTLGRNTGIGIPIRDEDNNILGIQIRLDTLNKNGVRYKWFSSYSDDEKYPIDGTSPCTPIDVHIPNEIKCNTIFVTEGHFKAMKLSNKFEAITLSVQGVHNWKQIPYILDTLKQRYPYLKHIYIMYDADMSYKETVLQPAIRMGLSLTNLPFEEYTQIVEDILALNRKIKTPIKDLLEPKNTVSNYLRKNAGIFKFNIVYCIWNDELGKGIDDLFNNGYDTNEIKKFQLIDFWEFVYDYLKSIEDERERISLRDGIETFEVKISNEFKRDSFWEHIYSKAT